MTQIQDSQMTQDFYQTLQFDMRSEFLLFLLQARAKYMSDEEAAALGMKRNNMFGRTTSALREESFDGEHLTFTLRKTVAQASYRRTKAGFSYPPESISVYGTCNPIDFKKWLQSASARMSAAAIARAFGQKTKDANALDNPARFITNTFANVKGESKVLNTIYAHVDLDMKDASPERRDQLSMQLLVDLGGHGVRVNTYGGKHLLIPHQYLPQGRVNIRTVLNEYNAMSDVDECVKVTSNLTPLPGTLHNGVLVTFDDFLQGWKR